MKQLFFIAVLLGFTGFASAQVEEKPVIEEKIVVEGKPLRSDKQKSQEIIIRKKGDKDAKITVEINGDKVLVNGKPLSEFKDGDVTINKRNITIWDGKNNLTFAPDEMELMFKDRFQNMGKEESYAFLGVTTGVDNDGNDDTKPNGAAITNVTKGSAADKAGLKEGDVITKINDKKVSDPSDLSEVVRSFKPKEEVTVYYKREGKEKSAKAVLGERKESNAMGYTFSNPGGVARSYTLPRIPRTPRTPGVITIPRVEELQEGAIAGEPWNFNFDGNNKFEMYGDMFSRRPKIGLKIQDVEEGSGVKILDAEKDSPAEKAGLKKDDVITEINGKKIENTDDAREQLKPEEGKNSYSIKAKRNGSEMNFEVKIPKKLKTANL